MTVVWRSVYAVTIVLVVSGVMSCRGRARFFVCQNDSQCEDGNSVGICEPTAGCSFVDLSCATGRRYGRLSSAKLSETCVPSRLCGNGIVDKGEQCDDGNRVNGDGCTAGCVLCDSGDENFAWGRDGRCFSLYRARLPWNQAQQACVRRGGSLALPVQRETISAVAETLLKADSTKGDAADVASRSEGAHQEDAVWVGLSETQEEGRFEWLTHVRMSELTWRDGYPMGWGRVRSCGLLQAQNGSAVVLDAACAEAFPYVCEYQSPFTDPETGHSYWIVADALTWGEAQRICHDQGGYLATPSSRGERTLVLRRFRGSFWVGAQKSSKSDGLLWSNGERWRSSLTRPRATVEEEDSGRGGLKRDLCLIVEGDATDRGWRLKPCGSRHAALCERNSSPSLLLNPSANERAPR